jgi:phage gp37-like protein
MTQALDVQAALTTIAAIELGMLARLKAVADAGGVPFTWRTLETYPVDWEEFLASDAKIRCPAAWVVFAGWNATEETNDGWVVDASFGLMVADENSRPGEAARRHGGPNAATEPGAYLLLLAAAGSLAGQTLGLDAIVSPIALGPCRPVAPSAASGARNMARYAAELTCRFLITPTADGADAPEELQALHANWDIPAFGSPFPIDRDPVAPGTQLPDDARADATDHVELETDQ